MLAALSSADHGLFERMMDATFPMPNLPDGMSTPDANGNPGDNNNNMNININNALVFGQAIKKKTVDTVMACKKMLLTEPPERMAEFWGTVSLPTAPQIQPPPPLPMHKS